MRESIGCDRGVGEQSQFMVAFEMAFSDYIIFADESGSRVLENPDPTFSLFVLNTVLVPKAAYAEDIVPRLQQAFEILRPKPAPGGLKVFPRQQKGP